VKRVSTEYGKYGSSCDIKVTKWEIFKHSFYFLFSILKGRLILAESF
jgi:hypothetical protein